MNRKIAWLAARAFSCLVLSIFFAAPSALAEDKPAVGAPAVKAPGPSLDKRALAKEWKQLAKAHPRFARAIITEQVVLMAVEREEIVTSICLLLRSGHPVLFQDFWKSRCNQITLEKPDGVIGCLTETHRDPADCFSSDSDTVFFDDPTGRYPWPPKLPGRSGPPTPEPPK